MKKLIALLVLVALVATMLCACGKFTCDICEEEKSGKKYTGEIMGEEVVYCQDCRDDLEELNDLFG